MAPVKSLKRGYKLVEMPIFVPPLSATLLPEIDSQGRAFVTLWTLMRYKIVLLSNEGVWHPFSASPDASG